jgi:AcrR family transcriptional regulator
MATTKVATKRAYNSSRRALQAAQTREAVLQAGTALFSTRGWAGTTLAAIAEQAGVSVETVYQGFGSKKGLLRAAMEVAVVGDSEPVPFADRPEALALAEGTVEEGIARAAALVATIHERSARLWQAIIEAASADDEVAGWRFELEQGRRVEVARSVALILGVPADELLATMLWVLYSPETYLKLVDDGGLDRDGYEALLAEASRRLIEPADRAVAIG